MSKKTLEELLKENNKKINIEELTKRGYNTINDFLKLNKDGNLLGFLKEVLNQLAIPFHVESQSYLDLFSFKAVYSISTTRFKYHENKVKLIPIRCLDAKPLTYTHTPIYETLMEGMHTFIQQWPKAMTISSF